MALVHCHFSSEILRMATAMDVILPEPAWYSGDGLRPRPGPGERFPTLYLLHGLSDDETIWQRRTSIERYVRPLGLAVVMPAVHRSFYTDMMTGARYWTFISEEVPRLARTLFPLAEDRERNFVAGNSMGGYGAFKLALAKPEMFAAAASLSGVNDLLDWADRAEGDLLAECRNIFGSPEALRGSPNDLFALAEQTARRPGPKPKLFQCCGTDDFLYQNGLRFKAHAERLGFDLTYEEGPGNHSWDYWDAMIPRVLQWLPR